MYESGEMYLETILILGIRKNLVRAVDVAEEMGILRFDILLLEFSTFSLLRGGVLYPFALFLLGFPHKKRAVMSG